MLSKVFAANSGGEYATEALPEIRAKKLAHKNDHLHRTRSDVRDRDILLWQAGLRRLAPEAAGRRCLIRSLMSGRDQNDIVRWY